MAGVVPPRESNQKVTGRREFEKLVVAWEESKVAVGRRGVY